MTTPFTFDLTISLPDGGRLAKQLLNIYFADMPADINQSAYDLCEADKAVQAQKFAGLTLKRADVWSSEEGGLKVFAKFSVSGEDSAFVEKVIAKYIDGFPEYLRRASSGYFPHAEVKPDSSLQPTDWNVAIQ